VNFSRVIRQSVSLASRQLINTSAKSTSRNR
jgi:hypothetical protein